MYKLFLIITLTILLTGKTYSQVLVSNVVEGEILLGPNNVNHHKEKVTNQHFSKIEDFKEELDEKKENLSSKIQQLEAKKSLKKREQKKLNAYRFDLAKIMSEKVFLNQLIVSWMNTIKHKKTLLALSHLGDDVCFEINTNKGLYNNDQLLISRAEAQKNGHDAFIPIRSRTSEGYMVEGMGGTVVLLNTPPRGMKPSKDGGMYIKENKKRGGINLNLSLKSRETNEVLEIQSWNKVDCFDR